MIEGIQTEKRCPLKLKQLLNCHDSALQLQKENAYSGKLTLEFSSLPIARQTLNEPTIFIATLSKPSIGGRGKK